MAYNSLNPNPNSQQPGQPYGQSTEELPHGFTTSPIGNIMNGTDLWDPATGTARRTGQQKGTDAGQALRALAEASGLPLLGYGSSSGSGTGVGGAPSAHVPYPDTAAANAGIFARAKDQAGQTARAALQSLQGEMSGRGILGSGIEGGETAKIIGRAGQGVNEVTREQAIQDASNLGQAGRTQYQGEITQRGQDINAAQQAAQRQQQMIEGLLSVLPPGLLF